MIALLASVALGLWAPGGASSGPQSPPPADYKGGCTDGGCHAEYGKRPVAHAPVASGSCDACHEKKAGTQGHRFELTAEGGELCTECHDDISEDRAYVHGPAASGDCTACHDPHASDHPGLLSAPTREVCTKCHQAMKTLLAKRAHTHVPAQEDCTACHEPHGADNRMMVQAAPPILCYSCHDDISDAIDDATVAHSPATRGKACMNCHDVHASDHSHLLVAGSMEVCLSCHGEAIETPSGTLPGLKQLLAENPTHHGPIAQQDCISCHADVHGGERFRLLGSAYPAAFYAPYDEARYALCFDCHDAEAFQETQTEELTGFRNGDRNLHFLHVNRKTKGRTCRACHQVHAARKPRLIADSVPFGQWRIPIGFEQTPTGGSCQPGCHRPYGYDRESPVENRAPADRVSEPAKPAKPETSASPDR